MLEYFQHRVFLSMWQTFSFLFDQWQSLYFTAENTQLSPFHNFHIDQSHFSQRSKSLFTSIQYQLYNFNIDQKSLSHPIKNSVLRSFEIKTRQKLGFLYKNSVFWWFEIKIREKLLRKPSLSKLEFYCRKYFENYHCIGWYFNAESTS